MASMDRAGASVLQQCWDVAEDVRQDGMSLLNNPNVWRSLVKGIKKVQRIENFIRIFGGYRFDFTTKSENGTLYCGRIVCEKAEPNSSLPTISNMGRLQFLRTCVSDVRLLAENQNGIQRSLLAKGYDTKVLYELTAEKCFTGIEAIFLYLRERLTSSYHYKGFPKNLRENSCDNRTFIDFPPIILSDNRLGFFQAEVVKLDGIPADYVLGRGICYDAENRRIIDRTEEVEPSSFSDACSNGSRQEFFEVFLSKEETDFKVSLKGYVVQGPIPLIRSIFEFLNQREPEETANWQSQITKEIKDGVTVFQFPEISMVDRKISINAYIGQGQEPSFVEGNCWDLENSCLDWNYLTSVEPSFSQEESSPDKLLRVCINGSSMTVLARIYKPQIK